MAKHPIQVVAKRTGLSIDTIRAWEKRYGAVTPERSSTSRRLYTDAEVERLQLLRRATLAGRRIGDVAQLSSGELAELVGADEAALEAAQDLARAGAASRPVTALRETCLAAVRALDAGALELALNEAAARLSLPELFDGLLVPLLEAIGEGWQAGTLRVAHEHLASALIRSFLSLLRAGSDLAGTGPEVVVTTPVGQLHELGALGAAVMAAREGWNVTYLGPNLPAHEIAAAARARNCRAVALSIVYPADDPRVGEELRALRSLLPRETTLLVGGRAAGAYRQAIEAVGARIVRSLAELGEQLQRLRDSVR